MSGVQLTGVAEANHLTFNCIQVTPQLATEFLRRGPPQGGNTKKNRTVMPYVVDKWCTAMDRGEWVLGEPILFDEDGHLMEGQHRLKAIVKHNGPIWLLTISGFPTEDVNGQSTFRKTGIGVTKTIPQMLSTMGYENSKELGSMLRHVWNDENNILPTRSGGGGSTRGWSLSQAEELLEKYPEITDAIKAPGVWANRLVPRSLSAFLWWKFHQKDHGVANEFFVDLIRASNEESDTDPICLLRQRLVANRDSQQKMQPKEIAALTIKAWNAVRSGEGVGQLRFGKNEKFPEVQ